MTKDSFRWGNSKANKEVWETISGQSFPYVRSLLYLHYTKYLSTWKSVTRGQVSTKSVTV